MKRKPAIKLNDICALLDKTEQELAHVLGISRVALKAIDCTGAPLYLKLALAGFVCGLVPDDILNRIPLDEPPR